MTDAFQMLSLEISSDFFSVTQKMRNRTDKRIPNGYRCLHK
jgi:hypothetical protein